MLPTIPWMQRKFDEFNELLFNGSLDPVQFAINRRSSSRGTCSWSYRGGKVVPGSIKISLSAFYEFPERDLELTLIHEMIHAYWVQNGYPKEGHGPRFKREAIRISSSSEYKISPNPYSFSYHSDERAVAGSKRKKMRLYFFDGNDGRIYYMSCKPENDGTKASCQLLEQYPAFKFLGGCVSAPDFVQGKHSTIRNNGGWSARSVSREDFESVRRSSEWRSAEPAAAV